MASTNTTAAQLIEQAIKVRGVITVKCPNGDTLTASDSKVLRWGRSRLASHSGAEIHEGHAAPGTIGALVVEHCGRGSATMVARDVLAGDR
jgi:hypothetical protein